jgi:hypothetical protein
VRCGNGSDSECRRGSICDLRLNIRTCVEPCSQSAGAADCQSDLGTAMVCGQDPGGASYHCHIACPTGSGCPNGMRCSNFTWCIYD